jgi:hypothetical protein
MPRAPLSVLRRCCRRAICRCLCCAMAPYDVLRRRDDMPMMLLMPAMPVALTLSPPFFDYGAITPLFYCRQICR